MTESAPSFGLPNDSARVAALRKLNILDTPAEERFDRITRLARRIFDVPVALVSLVEDRRQWFKSRSGLSDVCETSRDVSFCSVAIQQPDTMVVPDATADPRFADNPLVTGDFHLRFYAGHPLETLEGYRVGSMCIIDRKPREFSDEDRQTLKDLAAMVQAELYAPGQEATLERLREVNRQWRSEKENFEAFMNNSPCVIYLKDAESRNLFINKRGEEVFGHKSFELYGKSDADFLPALIAKPIMENDQRILKSGIAEEVRESAPGLDGRMRHWISLKFPIRHSSGQRLLGGVSVEVTAQREAEEAVRTMGALQGAVLDHVPVSIISADAEGTVLTFNPTAERWLGYRASEVIGRMKAHEFHDPQEILRCALDLAQELERPVSPGIELFSLRLEKEPTFEREWMYIRRDGSRFPVQLSLTALRTSDGAFDGFVAVARDITASKQAETALLAAKEAAEQANTAKSAFVATMSHEVRTPLNGIIGLNAMLLDTTLAPEQRQLAESVRTSANSLLFIVNDVLDFSKMEAGRLTLEAIDFDLSQLIRELTELNAPRAGEKGLGFEIKVAPQTPSWVTGDPGRLRQVLNNLVGNAIKFSTQGKVTVNISSTPGPEEQTRLRFAVTDQGIGIPREAQARIFEPFSQADSSTTRQFGGTGLGLAICRQLVELMDGKIGVESRPGEGATFTFSALLMEAEAPAESRATTGPLAPLPKLRVLLAEDSGVNRRVVTYQLHKFGCEVREAHNGQQAVEAVCETPFDVVLMDCQMPVMDGYAAARAIREYEEAHGGRRVPIIALTANALSDARNLCVASGMDDHLSKPCQPGDLHRVLAGIAEANRPVHEQAPLLDAGELGQLREECGDDENFQAMVQLFLAEARAMQAEWKRALEMREPERSRRAAHQLRGAASNFGAKALQKICRQMEKESQVGDLTRVARTAARADEALDRVLEALARECASAELITAP